LLFGTARFVRSRIAGRYLAYVTTVRNVLAQLLVAGTAWYAFTAATTNVAPQKVIDRSVVDERSEIVRQQAREAAAAAAKRAAEAPKGDAK
jgi:hypothetical protein